MSEYDQVITGSLRIQNGGVSKHTKKRKRSKKKKECLKQSEENIVLEEQQQKNSDESESPTKPTDSKDSLYVTKSQAEWQRKRDKRLLESVLSQAAKSHKQRIIEFNQHLGNLTEHFDIQKVSWTK